MFNINKFNQLIDIVKSPNGTILNNKGIEYDEEVLSLTNNITGKNNTTALHEIHIFLGPVWDEINNIVDDEIVKKYDFVVEQFNNIMYNTYENSKLMKNPLLALNFDIGYLTVMQCSLYLLSNSRKEVIKCCHMLAELFKNAGFIVLREKIEASFDGIDGIPLTANELVKSKTYFEFHIRVEHIEKDNCSSFKNDEIKLLEKISDDFTKKFETPVPLSHNKNKDNNGIFQKYLNIRFRNENKENIVFKLNNIVQEINKNNLKVGKIIKEWVWYDTYPELDQGWIDPR
jgi:hypothetical protein